VRFEAMRSNQLINRVHEMANKDRPVAKYDKKAFAVKWHFSTSNAFKN
jgi:hypothetical protein